MAGGVVCAVHSSHFANTGFFRNREHELGRAVIKPQIRRAGKGERVLDQSPDLLRAHKLSTGSLNADATRGERGWRWTNLLQAACGKQALAVGDQVVVSGSSFLTTVLIGRATSASELGVYALG